MSCSIWHVCSLVVQFSPQKAATVKSAISQMHEAEVVATNEQECKFVVLMESEDSDLLYQKIESIQEIPGVLAVSLVYHQQDEQIGDLT